MPGYAKRLLVKFNHDTPNKPQYSLYQAAPKVYSKEAHAPIPDDTKKVNNDKVTVIQQVIGSVLYFARAVDLTNLPGLGSIAIKQSQATEQTKKKVKHLLDHLDTMPC